MKKVCVVTGSSSGIGASIAKHFAVNGWHVALNYSRDKAAAEDVAAECRALGVEVIVVRCDVSRDEECRQFAAEVEAQWGGAGVLVNNAGTTKFVPGEDLEGLTADDFSRIFSVNVTGVFQVSRAMSRLLALSDGSGIVNVSSLAAVTGTGSSIAYSASKAALNGLTVCLARALAPRIRVNAVAPGFVETPWQRNALGPEGLAKRSQAYKHRALLQATLSGEDVAEAVWWLGVKAQKVTGEILALDAGVRLGRM